MPAKLDLVLFWQCMLVTEFCRRQTVFFAECPVEAGVIAESVLLEQNVERKAGQNCIFAGVQALFQYVLMERDSHVILEYMRNMVLAYKEKCGKAIQA